ncbi:SidA/IucD/PvdA family monooxygenase [Ramlibacter sp.]|uniref:lysine N(6)-hydroxylase/L-ornithine N(5)-oxygenase family protein n=1 Tax=Ramlibacter sp. TaxID=1917967 RepID=UPI00179FBD54|nr:SidA/IucD/PvdA family monooxygenase [Ramlibacter sp.]MBA2672107.1 lysine N(6)-hydroxylase/L-ornithine N(5)-oxygenase family protein [Ramlibacter sp.]
MLDILGIGFGPSNLALAICIREFNESQERAGNHGALQSMFFEQRVGFQWHKDMLIDGATMQISFLKDLVTLRNPTSSFSFLNYLKRCGRLEDFINLKTFYPTRVEYANYLEWAASQLTNCARYDCQVEEVRLRVNRDRRQCMEVVVRHRDTQDVGVYSTQNLVLGTGLRPKLPKGIAESGNVVHSSSFLSLIKRIDPQRARRFLVVGGGQSAAEIVNHLYDRYQSAEIVAVFPNFGYKPADDSHFVNQIFDSRSVDLFYAAADNVKSFLLERHADTNYGVVDSDLIAQLYRKAYGDKVRGRERLRMRRLSRLEALSSQADLVTAGIRDLHGGGVTEERFDAVVMATGYHPPSLTEIVPAVTPYMSGDFPDQVTLDRSYAVKTNAPIGGRIYLQGASESQHGFTVTLLSALPTRSQEILQDIVARRENQDVSQLEEVRHAV